LTVLLAAESPGTHPTVDLCSSKLCQLNTDTLLSSLIAIVITIIVGLAVAAKLRSGRPGKLQMLFELFLSYVRTMVRTTVSKDATFVVPLAATIAFYIFIANWLDFFPLHSPIEPANADLNQTAAMALVVIFVVEWYSVKTLGWRRFFKRFTKPFEMNKAVRTVFVPLNVVEELVKPVTLSLRLFGNVFAGVVMVFLLGQLYGAGASLFAHVAYGLFGEVLLIVWKAFDVFFVGSIQAFIFMLLTIIYFDHAREGIEHELHDEEQHDARGHEAHDTHAVATAA
jgi:F-type H+-transporting ATPase subunit a